MLLPNSPDIPDFAVYAILVAVAAWPMLAPAAKRLLSSAMSGKATAGDWRQSWVVSLMNLQKELEVHRNAVAAETCKKLITEIIVLPQPPNT